MTNGRSVMQVLTVTSASVGSEVARAATRPAVLEEHHVREPNCHCPEVDSYDDA